MNRVDTRIQSTNTYLGHIIYQALLLVQGIEYEKKDKKNPSSQGLHSS